MKVWIAKHMVETMGRHALNQRITSTQNVYINVFISKELFITHVVNGFIIFDTVFWLATPLNNMQYNGSIDIQYIDESTASFKELLVFKEGHKFDYKIHIKYSSLCMCMLRI